MVILFAIFLPLVFFAGAAWWLLFGGSQENPNRLAELAASEPIAERYLPLTRLLSTMDVDYLSKQPGMTPAKIRSFRAHRRQLVRRNLSDLIADFHSFSFLITALMVQSPVDRSDLASDLRNIKISFYSEIVKVHVRLLAQALGLSQTGIDAAAVTRALDALSSHVRSLQPTAEPDFA